MSERIFVFPAFSWAISIARIQQPSFDMTRNWDFNYIEYATQLRSYFIFMSAYTCKCKRKHKKLSSESIYRRTAPKSNCHSVTDRWKHDTAHQDLYSKILISNPIPLQLYNRGQERERSRIVSFRASGFLSTWRQAAVAQLYEIPASNPTSFSVR